MIYWSVQNQSALEIVFIPCHSRLIKNELQTIAVEILACLFNCFHYFAGHLTRAWWREGECGCMCSRIADRDCWAWHLLVWLQKPLTNLRFVMTSHRRCRPRSHPANKQQLNLQTTTMWSWANLSRSMHHYRHVASPIVHWYLGNNKKVIKAKQIRR